MTSPSPLPHVSPAALRQAMGHFPTGVTVVTATGRDGEPVGTTANAVTSLSLDPPLLLVCFATTSLTLDAIRSCGAFAVNVLGAAHRELGEAFARRGYTDAWTRVRREAGPTGCPRFADALAIVECTVEHRLPGGDHEIVVGRAVDAVARDGEPLVFFRGGYTSLAA